MKKYFLAIINALLLLLSVSFVADAQIAATGPQKPPITFPVIPFIAEYEYAPYYFSQDIYEHPQYSLIETVFAPDEPASLQIILTEKQTQKRVFYCNSEAKVKMLLLAGGEAVLSKIEFKKTQSGGDNALPNYEFAFRDKQGQPIIWRVVPTSQPSERGAGLTPKAAASGLRLEYRDNIGTTVGEGTIVKIGDKLFEAAPWAETSSPPYFYAYHGSFTVGRHIGALTLGSEKWQLTASPNELKEGAEWVFADERGRRRVFKIIAKKGDELTISEPNTQQNESTQMSFIVLNTPQGFAMRSLKVENRGRQMQIAFSPELPLYGEVSGKMEVGFTVSQGKMDKAASGTIVVERVEDKLRLRWLIKSPDWAKSRILDGLLKFEPNGYQIETTQAAAK